MIGLTWGGPLTRVLAIGAHPDDIEIGCGATLLRLAGSPGARLSALVLTGEPSRQAESESALTAFWPGCDTKFHAFPDGRLPSVWNQVKQQLEDHAAVDETPTLVLAPRRDDAHQDHRLLGKLVPTVWRGSLVLHYEIPKWDGDLSTPNVFVGVDGATAQRKIDLLQKYFPSQKERDWWDDEFFLGMMRLRGVECRQRYAEAFFSTKLLLEPVGAEQPR